MKELQNIRQSYELARDQEIDFFRSITGETTPAEIAQNQAGGDLLFFPRKKLRMQKLRSGNWEPRAWFVQDRLEERVTALDQPTNISHEGITSGLRSAIIMEPNGTYLRLKGVAPKTFEAQRPFIGPARKRSVGARRGLLEVVEAYNELTWVTLLNITGFDFSCMKPAYVEYFLPPFKPEEAKEFLTQYALGKRKLDHLNLTHHKPSVKMDLLDGFIYLAERGYYGRGSAFVSAFQITADTRLDEALYELTRTELTGDKRVERDELVHYLAHNAGKAMGFLNARGLTWGAKLYNTNSHIGNFVLGRRCGKMHVDMCDFSAILKSGSFGKDGCPFIVQRGERGDTFWQHAEKEMELFRDDFFSEYTMSHPTSLKFRHFSPELRESSYQAFQTGYAIVMSYVNNELHTIMPTVAKPNRLVVPEKTILSEHDFRERVDYVLGKK